MFSNPYYGSAQVSTDRIDAQIRELEAMRAQVQKNSQPSINQTFQLAPQTQGLKYASSIEEVSRELVFADSVFFNKDMTNMWIKNTKGQITPYEINQLVEKDEKDLIIDQLKAKIDALERGGDHAEPNSTEHGEHAKDPIQK